MLGVADQIAKDRFRLVKIKEEYISCACPFHKGGMENNPSFWIHRPSGRWGCFSCKIGGSSLKFLLKELGVKDKRAEAEIEAAEKENALTREVSEAKRRKKARATFRGVHTLPDSLLGVYDWLPSGMIEDGFREEVLRDHDIGFDRERERITFPVRDIFGSLVGIYGRATRMMDLPRYLAYGGPRTVRGKHTLGELGEWYPGYSNEGVHDHLWRGHLVYPRVFDHRDSQVILVEGFKAALWVVQCGWLNTVAVMGSKLTQAQERIVRRMGAQTFVLFDNDEAGRKGSYHTCRRLGSGTYPVHECSYPLGERYEDAQPDDLTTAELEVVLSSAQRVGGKYVIKHMGRQFLENKQRRGRKEDRRQAVQRW
jgi:DNA primase